MGLTIVSGEPRSGTSLAMETLRLLGKTIWGDAQPQVSRPSSGDLLTDELRASKSRYMNEVFWEVGGIVMHGLSYTRLAQQKANVRAMTGLTGEERIQKLATLDSIILSYEANKESALKIIWNGLPRTDDDILAAAKIVLVTRDPLHIAESQRNLNSAVDAVRKVDKGFAFASPRGLLSFERYVISAMRFLNWVQKPKNSKLDILFVDYEDFFDSERSAIPKIVTFLGLTPTQEQLAAAMANVDPAKRRSADVVVPEGEDADWAAVRGVYEMLKLGAFSAARSQVEDLLEAKRNDPENAKWLDQESMWPMNPDLVRNMAADPRVKSGLMNVCARNKVALMHCMSCRLFSQTGDSYTVTTPSDLDDVVRNKINCSEEGQVTLEQCQNHWKQNRGSAPWLQSHMEA